MHLVVDNFLTLKQQRMIVKICPWRLATRSPSHTVILERSVSVVIESLVLKTNCSLVGKLFKAQQLGRARIAPRRTGQFTKKEPA
jgi:hypothetical protein